ncbi:MAG: hypothetical protein ACTSWA_05295 [Candidatus Thorarchaeota archaeon]
MEEIIVAVKPVFEVIDDAEFDRQSSFSEKTEVKYCYNCGSPLMYIRVELGDDGSTDTSWYCAVCGRMQGGITLPSPFKEENGDNQNDESK